MRVPLVLAIIGRLARMFCLAFIPPVMMAMWDGDWWSSLHFMAAGAGGALLGTAVSWGFERPRLFKRAEALAVVAGTWVAVAALAAVPYIFAGLSPIDAMFESMSGLTTTGATILQDFSVYGRAFFLWRAMTQWFGGLGVIALFVVVLPRLGIAGRQLFFAEASTAPGEGVSPQVRDAASRLWILYLALTAICAALLMLTGFDLYEASVHAFTTLAAGGFSPNGSSIAGYANPAAEWVLVAFMFIAGASYPLWYKVFTGSPGALLKDEEFIFYSIVTVAGALALAALLNGGLPDLDTLRAGAFQSASVISSTGFASTDYNLWSDACKVVLLIVTIVGGCAGSAAGGPKAIRHLFVLRHIRRELRQVLHPRAVINLRYKGRGVPPAVLRAVFTLVALYVGGYFVFGAILVLLGTEPIAAFTASIACLGNVGPGFNEVGPMGNFANLPALSKIVLTIAMWVGRLEILTVMALLHPHVWRKLRFKAS